MDRASWDDRYSTGEMVWSVSPNQFVEAETEDLEPGRALDVACGEGRNALWLAARGWQVSAVDFSESGIATGRARAAEMGVEIEWIVADVLEWDPEPGAFDLVVVAYLQLPAAPLRAALGRSASGMAPGGTLVAVGHDVTNLADGYGGPQDASVLWTPDDVGAALRDAVSDLAIEKAGVVERRVTTDDGERVALDTLVRATRARPARA